MMLAAPAAAQDATWLATPGSNSLVTGANWSSGTVPTGTAYFGASSTTALTTATSAPFFGGWTFNTDAGDYAISIGNSTFFTGTGIVVNGGSVTVTIPGRYRNIYFQNSSSAGSATINNNGGSLLFSGQSNAGSAILSNAAASNLNFSGSSSAGNSVINSAGNVQFVNNSTGGNAQINGTASTANFDFSGSAGLLGDYKVTAGGARRRRQLLSRRPSTHRRWQRSEHHRHRCHQ